MDYEGDTDETNRNTDDSQSENNDFVRNLDKEEEYKKHDECTYYYSTVTKINELKKSESKVEQAHIEHLLAKDFPIEFIQSIIIKVHTCEHKMIEFGKENKKINYQDKWNYYHHFSILPFLGVNLCLTLLHMSNKFVHIHNTEQRID